MFRYFFKARRDWLRLAVVLASPAPALPAHVHVQVGYSANVWDLHVLDFDSGRFAPDEAPFFVSFAGRRPMPDDPRFVAFLGSAGNVWILPQNEFPGLLNLGIGVSGIGDGVFSGNQVRLELHHVEGPGHFALFTTSPFGAPLVHFASLDGVQQASDFIALPAVNGHVHVNWAFTASGVYRLGFAASGILVTTGQPSASPVVDFTFTVEGPPTPALSAPRIRPDGSIEFLLTAPPGSRVQLQGAAEIGRWEILDELTPDAVSLPITLPLGNGVHHFYRAVLPEIH